MNEYCFLNGEIIPIKDAKVSILDIGILRGYGIFEVLRTYNEKPFLYDQHFDRFTNSATSMGLKIPFSKEETLSIIKELLFKNGGGNREIRMVLTGGEAIGGIGFDSDKPNFFIINKEIVPLDKKLYQEGVRLMSIDHQRDLPKSKTTNYIFPISNKISMDNKFFDLLYFSNGKVLESSTSNFFIYKDNKIITAKDGVLFGTTRNFVIDLLKNDYEVEERDISIDELKFAEEAFLTATNKDILPVVGIDDRKIGNGMVGENSKTIMELYNKKVKEF